MNRLIVFFIMFCACAQSPSINTSQSDSTRLIESAQATGAHASSPSVVSDSNTSSDEYGDNMMQDYFVVVADSASNYYQLRQSMFDLSKKTGLSIDTFGRYFNSKLGIILSEDSEDESYAGAYYPRRFEGAELSIEYYNSYIENCPKTSMALIAGQFTEFSKAEKHLLKIRAVYPKAYTIQVKLYNGCMH